MKKLIIGLAIGVLLTSGLSLSRADDLDRFDQSLADTERMINRSNRERISDNQRYAIEQNDMKEMKYQQRRMEQQLLQERIMDQAR